MEAQLAAALKRIEELERKLYGRKSEKMPRPEKELRREESEEDKEARRLEALRKRREHALLKEKLHKETVRHPVAEDAKKCPKCGAITDRPIGDGNSSPMVDYIPGYFVQRLHVQERLGCRCGQHIVTAPPPPRPLDNCQYGAGFIGYIITMKCADAIPLYRLAKQFQRLGVFIVRSTLNDLFHRAAAKLEALYKRLIELIRLMGVVQADETRMLMQRPNKHGFIWTFLAENLIAYRFSATRAGQTAADVLGGTEGTLVVDAYTGYNRVTAPDGRERAGCLAHVRRKFFDALGSAPAEAKEAMDLILAVYRVEHKAKAAGIVRTDEHLSLRKSESADAMDRFKTWLDAQAPRHPPKSPIGEAIQYTLNQWTPLTRFLQDAAIPVDNNRSEAALRIVALGRKNFLFVGDEDSGENLAGLYSLVATCEANRVDPIAYLADVLMRVDTHPASRIDELLPHRWKPSEPPA